MPKPTDEFTKAIKSALEEHTEVVPDYMGLDDPEAINDIYEKRYDEALASIQASTVQLFTRLVGEDETFEPYSPEEVWKKAKNELRRELRTRIDQLIKDLTNGGNNG